MARLGRRTEEQREIDEAVKQQRRLEKEAAAQAAALERAKREFFETPAGLARLAFERSDRVFQYSADVMSQQAIVVAMVGSTVAKANERSKRDSEFGLQRGMRTG